MELIFGRIQLSQIIWRLRLEQNLTQQELYGGLCAKKVYSRLESGEGVLDELLSERLMSRLHIQYKLLEISLNEENFSLKEYRYRINRLIWQKKWKEAECLLREYQKKAPSSTIHRQYFLGKWAERWKENDKKRAGKLFFSALELTMPVLELEERLNTAKAIAEVELNLYLGYRNCSKPFSMEEYPVRLRQIEENFLKNQIYAEYYFETALYYACQLLCQKQYETCQMVCQKILNILTGKVKRFYLAEFYFVEVVVKMRQNHTEKEERELLQQCKMAYWVSRSFGKEEVAEKIKQYSKEKWQWHIIE